VKRVAAVALAVSTVIVLFGEPINAVWAALVAVAAVWVLDPVALRAGLRVGAVLAIVFAAAVTAAVVAWAEGPQRGVELGGMVLLRLLIMTIAAGVLVRSVNAEKILRLTERLGLERLGLVLGLALNSLPSLAHASGDVWTAARVRSDGPLQLLRRVPNLGEVLLSHTARIAEEASAAASLRGHSALTRPGGRVSGAVRTVVVTGPPGGGKTDVVAAVAGQLQNEGVPVFGFIQPGILEDGEKVGFRLRDVATGDEAVLATRGERREGDFGTRFQFTDEGFRLGSQALSRVVPGSVVIVDELGPVELRGEGHMPAVRRALAAPGLRGAIIVVRRALVPSLLDELDASDAVVIDVENGGRGSAEEIAAALLSSSS
jgi:nucleoside-triphosphatase THEP1/energy-coupling factor transporter transmembrane protein EcfT